jgi:hypothetical protein
VDRIHARVEALQALPAQWGVAGSNGEGGGETEDATR